MAAHALGLDGAAVQLEAHLHKLLLYEPGGQFSLEGDTEKEPGLTMSKKLHKVNVPICVKIRSSIHVHTIFLNFKNTHIENLG